MESNTETTDAPAARAAFYLDKGGTGKSTTIGHIAVALANSGHDVVLIDLAGKQGDLAKLFGLVDEIDPERWPNIATVFQPEWQQIVDRLGADAAIDELTFATDEGPDLIPAHRGLDSLDVELETKYPGEEKFRVLDGFLTDYLDDRYDFILLDLPGVANNIVYNGVYAAQHVVAVVEAGPFESQQASALSDDLDRFRDTTGRQTELAMVVLNKLDARTSLANEYLERYRDEFGDVVAPQPVPNSQDIRNAAENGHTLFALEEPSSTAERALDAYHNNADRLHATITES